MRKIGRKMISCFIGVSMLASVCGVSADEIRGEQIEEVYVEETAPDAETAGETGLRDGISGDSEELENAVSESEVFYEVVSSDADGAAPFTQDTGDESGRISGDSTEEEENLTDGDELEDWEEAVETGTEEAAYEDYSAVPSPEEEEIAGVGAETDASVSGITEDVVIDDPIVSEISSMDPEAELAGVAEFTANFTNFYDQLEDPAKTFYEYRKNYFGDARKTDALTVEFAKDTAPYSFTCPAKKNESGKYTIDKDTEEYKAGHEKLLYYLRASFDAFYYDHPEVFWTRSTDVHISYGGSVNKDGIARLYPQKVTITPKAAFDGAAGLIPDFDAAVNETAEWIQGNSDYNRDGKTEVSELLQGVHDYVDNTCYYDSASLDTYKETGDYRIFTPAGAFLESVGRGVVCEGYSRAVKILCDKLGITCALVKGKASEQATIGHQWNVVRLDGDWFLVDATWDDMESKVKYTYYLRYQIEGRIIDSKIAGDNYTIKSTDSKTGTTRVYTVVTQAFAYPEIPYSDHTLKLSETAVAGCSSLTTYACGELSHPSAKRYQISEEHTYEGGICTKCGHFEGAVNPLVCNHEWKDEGSEADTVCTICGVRKDTVIAATHVPISIPMKDPTCTETGLTEGEVCAICREVFKPQEVIPAKGHISTVLPAKPATCTAPGISEGLKCSVCGATLKEQTAVPAKGHTPVVDPPVAATTTSTGLTSGTHCSVCGAILSPQQVTPKVEVTLKVKAPGMKDNKVTMKKGKTLQLKVTSNAEVTYSSSNKKVATVSSKGKIKAKKKGKATVTVKAGNKKVKIKVTVKA